MYRLVVFLLVLVPFDLAGAETPIPSPLTLDAAVRRALERNPSLVAARARVDAADGARTSASRRPNPTLSFEAEGYPLFTSPRPGFWSGQELTVRVDHEIETGGRRRLRTEAAAAGLEGSRSSLRDQERLVALDVQRAYLTAVLADTDHRFAETTLEDIDRTIALNRARFDQGEISGAELRRLQVERLRFVEDVFAAELTVKNARAALLALLGAPVLDQTIELADALTATAADVDASSVDAALAARPDALAARREAERAETLVRLQRAQRLPNLTLGGGYRRDFGADAVVVGVSFPVPLFNRHQGEMARAEAERRAADAHVAEIDTGVRLEVQRAANALRTNRARVDYLERDYLTGARESRDVALEAYRVGAADLIDFLDAQRAFRDTVRTHNRALFELRVSGVELAAALGSAIPSNPGSAR